MKPAHRLLPVVLLVITALPGLASTSADEGGPVSTSNALIEREVLRLVLQPLTMEELEVEADAWLGLLRERLREITTAELELREIRRRLSSAEAEVEVIEMAGETVGVDTESDDPASASDAPVEAVVEAEVTEDLEGARSSVDDLEARRTELVDRLHDLREEKTALADRVDLVLDRLEAKGGDVEVRRKFLLAVGGIDLEVKDANVFWTAITGWMKSKEGGVRWTKNLAWFLVILLVSFALSKGVGRLTRRLVDRAENLSTLMRNFLVIGIRRLVLALGFVVGLTALELDVGPIVAVIGGVSFVLAFALQNVLSNFACGLLIIAYRPYDLGDIVEICGVIGRVHAMTLVATTLRTLDNRTVILPNGRIWGESITNNTESGNRRVDLVFGISYGDDIALAIETITRVVAEHEKTLDEPEAMIRVGNLGDSSVDILCRPWCLTDDYWDVYWDITRGVKEEFDRLGITIPFPQRDVHVIASAGVPSAT